MTVQKDKVVEMHYTLKNDNGDVIDSSDGKDPMLFIQGHGNIIRGLEKALEGMKVGETCAVSVDPEDAYGIHHAEGIQEVPKKALEGIGDLEIGMQIQSQDDNGNVFVVHVKAINDETITIDANHPLAGEKLHFDVSINKVRDATKEELEHGHAHSDSDSH